MERRSQSSHLQALVLQLEQCNNVAVLSVCTSEAPQQTETHADGQAAQQK